MKNKMKQYLLGAIIAICSTIAITMGSDYGRRMAAVIFVVCLLLTVVINEISVRCAKHIVSQLAVVSVIPLLYFLSSVVFNQDMISHGFKADLCMAAIICICADFIVQYFIKLYTDSKLNSNSFWDRAFDSVKRHKWILIAIIILAIVRIPMMNLLQRWDAGEYYYRLSTAVSQFTYSSFTEYFNSFLLCNHPTMAFSMVYSIGEFAFPMQMIGVMIVNLVITLVALWCLYRMIIKIFQGVSELRAAVYTSLLGLLPIFLGTFGYFNPDYALAIFFVYVLYSFVYNKNILLFFCGLLCVQTKETGLVLLAALLCGLFIKHLLECKNWRFILQMLKDIKVYVIGAALLCQLFYMRFIGGVSKWQGGESLLKWDNDGYNCLGFQPDYIITKLKQQFILNFNWIFTIIIAAGCCILLYRYLRNRKSTVKKQNIGISSDIAAVAIVFWIYVLFSCLYITGAMARYNVAGDILLALTGLYMLERITVSMGKTVKVVISGVLGILLFIQSFLTIDPVTKLVFSKLETGTVDMVYVGNPLREPYYGDNILYNNQYSYIDKGFDYIMRDVGFDKDTDIVMFNNYIDAAGIHFNGNIPLYWVSWDPETQKRVYYRTNTLDIDVVYSDDLADGKIESGAFISGYENGGTAEFKNEYFTIIGTRNLKQRVIGIELPYYNVDMENALLKMSNSYNLIEKRTYSTLQGSMNYYIFEKK